MTKNFIMLPHEIFDSDRYRSLISIDRDILWLLIRKYNGYNNGNISLGAREAAAWYGCSRATANRALQRLENAEFITTVRKGHLVPVAGRQHVATTWRLNFVTASAAEEHPKPNQNAHRKSGNPPRRVSLARQPVSHQRDNSHVD